MSPDLTHESRPICAQCGQPFDPHSDTQAFCSPRCNQRYRREHNGDMSAVYPKRTFVCANPKCAKLVVTEGPRDHRSRFCSAQCERYYWRKCYQNMEGGRNQRFRNIGEFIRAQNRAETMMDGQPDIYGGGRNYYTDDPG